MKDKNPEKEKDGSELPTIFNFIPQEHRKTYTARFKELLGELSRAPNSSGRNNAKIYYTGRQLTQREAIYAKCADCMAYYFDGKQDCQMYHCFLYKWMPYGLLKKRRMPKQII